MTDTPKLAAALVAAQLAVKAIEKDKKVEYGTRWKYASSEAVFGAAADALAPNGLAFLPVNYSIVGDDGPELRADYLLLHESGECMTVESTTPLVIEKGKPADKATGTAKTYDLAYALRGVLLMQRVEEGAEVDERDDTKYEPPKRQKKAEPPKQQHKREEPELPPDPELAEKKALWGDIFTGEHCYQARLSTKDFAAAVGCTAKQVAMWRPKDMPALRNAHAALSQALNVVLADEEGNELPWDKHLRKDGAANG